MHSPRSCAKLVMKQDTEASSPEFLLSTCCDFPLTKPQILCLLVKPYMHEPKPLHCRLLWAGLGMDKETLSSNLFYLQESAVVHARVFKVYVWMYICVFTEGAQEYLLKI